MITEPDYESATNAAYYELSLYNGNFPKIDICDLISESENIVLKSYTQAAKHFNCSHNHFTYDIAPSEYGFTVSDKKKGKHIIFFNNLKDEKTIRFTLAHELGHIILGHTVDDDISDREANCFARNILCPIQFARDFDLTTAEEYADFFGVSMPMAIVSLAHINSDFYYITSENYQMIDQKIYSHIMAQSDWREI